MPATILTIVILTKNEEDNLPRCLEAIPSSYPIVVLDSGSTDKTLNIAESRGCSIHKHPWSGFAAQRNYALENCRITSSWVLFVDADEVFPSEFYEWFESQEMRLKDFDAVMVPSQLVFCGRLLLHAPGYPIYHPRLVRSAKVRFIKNHSGHGETIHAEYRTMRAPISYKHYFYEGDSAGWMRKHINNASAEIGADPSPNAKTTHRILLNRLAGRTVFRIPARFLYHYLWCRGFLDGRAGFRYSLMYTWYEMTKYLMSRAGG